MEKTLDVQHTLEITIVEKTTIDKSINEMQIDIESKLEGLSITAKQKKKPCAGCDGICCTKSIKEKHDGHHNDH